LPARPNLPEGTFCRIAELTAAEALSEIAAKDCPQRNPPTPTRRGSRKMKGNDAPSLFDLARRRPGASSGCLYEHGAAIMGALRSVLDALDPGDNELGPGLTNRQHPGRAERLHGRLLRAGRPPSRVLPGDQGGALDEHRRSRGEIVTNAIDRCACMKQASARKNAPALLCRPDSMCNSCVIVRRKCEINRERRPLANRA
jgi:hypothetical protein